MRSLAVLLLVLCGCAEPASEGDPAVVAQESRYRVVTDASASGPGVGMLDVRVEATGGWHIAPEAPVRLDLAAPDVTFVPAKLRAEHASKLDENVIEWSSELRAESSGGRTASGQLKFGICEGDAEQCVIIRRDLEIPLVLAHSDAL
jgi:hypothetical protein